MGQDGRRRTGRKAPVRGGDAARDAPATVTAIPRAIATETPAAPAGPGDPPAVAAVPAAPGAGFFICDFDGAAPKDDMASMEHPLFTLATRPDRRILRYRHGEAEIEVTPSVKGLATVHDKDVLIYCVSQLMAAINAGRPTSPALRLKAADLLLATNRESSGDGYRRLREALERLAGTRIVTNIATGGVETTRGFGLIDAWEIVRKARGGRMILVTVTLSDWIYRSVLSRSVLTLSRDYFALRKPLERRVYEIARKHCGRQAEWRIGLETLLKKTGSTSPRRVFRKMIRDIAEQDALPDYTLALEAGDTVRVRARARLVAAGEAGPALDAEAYAAARAAAPGYDPYGLEREWRAHWIRSGRPRLHDPEAAFVAFARARAARAPLR
jgi:plasmid replication initiation protein